MPLVEDFATEFQTTVLSLIGATDTTLNLTTTAGLPSSGNFMLRIEPAAGSASQYELVHCVVATGTSVTTVGTRAAAQEGTSGQSWTAGSLVTQVITRNGLVNAFLAFGQASGAYVATSETTTSGTYTGLATGGPIVTIVTGTQALVFIYASLSNSVSNNSAFMGFAVSGASTLAASDAMALQYVSFGTGGGFLMRAGAPFLVTGLTAGTNVFTAKYKSGGGNTSTFADRRLAVLPC